MLLLCTGWTVKDVQMNYINVLVHVNLKQFPAYPFLHYSAPELLLGRGKRGWVINISLQKLVMLSLPTVDATNV